jgi:hypothetical protein
VCVSVTGFIKLSPVRSWVNVGAGLSRMANRRTRKNFRGRSGWNEKRQHCGQARTDYRERRKKRWPEVRSTSFVRSQWTIKEGERKGAGAMLSTSQLLDTRSPLRLPLLKNGVRRRRGRAQVFLLKGYPSWGQRCDCSLLLRRGTGTSPGAGDSHRTLWAGQSAWETGVV